MHLEIPMLNREPPTFMEISLFKRKRTQEAAQRDSMPGSMHWNNLCGRHDSVARHYFAKCKTYPFSQWGLVRSATGTQIGAFGSPSTHSRTCSSVYTHLHTHARVHTHLHSPAPRRDRATVLRAATPLFYGCVDTFPDGVPTARGPGLITFGLQLPPLAQTTVRAPGPRRGRESNNPNAHRKTREFQTKKARKYSLGAGKANPERPLSAPPPCTLLQSSSSQSAAGRFLRFQAGQVRTAQVSHNAAPEVTRLEAGRPGQGRPWPRPLRPLRPPRWRTSRSPQ